MRKTRFSEEQIIVILKEGDGGVPPEELCRRHGITRGSLPYDLAGTDRQLE